MNIVQVKGIHSGILGKIHLSNIEGYLCGLGGYAEDLVKVNQFDFSKGFCSKCKVIYNIKYHVDSYEFLIVKLKLGVKV